MIHGLRRAQFQSQAEGREIRSKAVAPFSQEVLAYSCLCSILLAQEHVAVIQLNPFSRSVTAW